MEKKFSYTTERFIHTIPLNDNLVAFIDQTYRDGELTKEVEGTASKEVVEATTRDQEVKKYSAKVRKGVECYVGLFRSSIRESVRTHLFGTNESIEEYKKHYIKNPYTYLKQQGKMTDVELMYLSYYDHNLYDESFNIQPKAMHFDYIQAHMNNRCYDLEDVLQKLRKREDIEWIPDRYDRKEQPAIKDIPHYNSDEDHDKCLEFIWRPSKEDFEKVSDYMDDSRKRYDSVCSEVFGLTKLKPY